MRIAGVLHESLVDGPGIRTVLFTQGCIHVCPQCHSQSTWNIAGGEEKSTEDICREILSYENLDGLTISGGEPFMQSDGVLELIKQIRQAKPGLNIWLYTGYKIDELIEMASLIDSVRQILLEIDVLVDGRYVHQLRDLKLHFRGSKNQRILSKENYLPLLKQLDMASTKS